MKAGAGIKVEQRKLRSTPAAGAKRERNEGGNTEFGRTGSSTSSVWTRATRSTSGMPSISKTCDVVRGVPRPYRACQQPRRSDVTGDSEPGTLAAPFTGIHGWYLRNDAEAPIVVRLKVAGFHELLHE